MFTLMRSTQNPSYLSSKDITPVVTGQVIYVYLDEIHAESLVSLLKRHYPGCHGTGKLCLLDEIHAESLVSLLKRHYPGCHGTGKLCFLDESHAESLVSLLKRH
jgi:hypothetical protein